MNQCETLSPINNGPWHKVPTMLKECHRSQRQTVISSMQEVHCHILGSMRMSTYNGDRMADTFCFGLGMEFGYLGSMGYQYRLIPEDFISSILPLLASPGEEIVICNYVDFQPNSKFMFHQGDHGFMGTHKQFQTEAEEGRKIETTMMNIYIDSMKERGFAQAWPRERCREWLTDKMNKKEEVYLTPDVAIGWGFADETFGKGDLWDWSTLTQYD